jgi:hypothetical protein
MNDDQIRSELERRAGSAPTQPDWTKRALLPAVWREIDARPQPVVTSRWSTGVSVAALVVALLVLVVAVPRLAPQPAGPSPRELEVLSAQTFAAGVHSGALTGQTVLVNGAIVQYDGPVIFGGYCGPNGPACLLGQLESVEPRVTIFGPDLAVADAAQSTVQRSNGWPFWQRVEPPIRGTLMLSVNGESVEYVGRVVPGGDQLTWSAGQVKTQLDVNARDLDEVVLVNSWLVGLDAVISCAFAPSPIPGLPLRDGCGRMSWLSDESVVATPDSPVTSPQAIGVQPDAFWAYAPDPSARSGPWPAPQRAVYGVARRLYANGCIDPTQPCWGWSVVARLSQPAPDFTPPSLPIVPTPQIAPSPTAPPASGPTYSCTGPDWAGGQIELTDHLGFIESCVATRGDSPDERIVVSEISPGVVGVTWEDCARDGASLQLWSREDAPDRPRYVLTIEKRPQVLPPRGCRGVIPGVTAEVTFINAELAPENLVTDIEAHLVSAGLGTDGIATSAGEFYLTLSSGAPQYTSDDPIDIQAQLFYEGDQPTIDLSGVFSLVNGFGVEQLDGDLEMGAGWAEPCVPHELRSGEPLVVPYEKSAGWSQDDPNADFYRDWSADPLLHLPAGTWLVTAYSDFMIGSGCSGQRVQLETSIVVTVR